MSGAPTRRAPRWVVLAAALGAVTMSACATDDDAAPAATVPTATPAPATTAPPSTEAPAEPSTTTSTSSTTTTTTTSLPIVDPPPPIPPEPPAGMELVWSDEFDGDAIDRSNWTYDIGGWGWGNGEVQYYTDRPENARLENGLLVIELRQERFEDAYYTSARLKTKDLQEFQYGRIEARLKVPKGSGTWPAFWMLGTGFEQEAADPAFRWPNVGEIDIMEYVGREPDLVLGTVHGPGYAGSSGISQWNRQDFDIGDDFHTFAIDWDEAGIRWYFDGEMFFDVPRERVGDREWVFDKPFFMLLNLALGGTLGGNIDLALEYPIRYYADYVRVYQPVDGE
jgi:beta-glucanase (GH16 family)